MMARGGVLWDGHWEVGGGYLGGSKATKAALGPKKSTGRVELIASLLGQKGDWKAREKGNQLKASDFQQEPEDLGELVLGPWGIWPNCWMATWQWASPVELEPKRLEGEDLGGLGMGRLGIWKGWDQGRGDAPPTPTFLRQTQ